MLKDVRGEFWAILDGLTGYEFFLQKTMKGRMRGGDYHNSPQYEIVLDGKMEVWIKKDGKVSKRIYYPGEAMVLEARVPHCKLALEDSLTLEWISSHDPKDKFIDEEFREIVKSSWK
jgi:hypothetical protein